MSTRSAKAAATTPLSEVELAILSKQLEDKEKRIHEEARQVEKERSKMEQTQREHDELLIELEAMRRERVPKPSTSRTPEPQPQIDPITMPIENNASLSYTLKEAVNMIPNFNSTAASLLTFTRACRRARELIPRHAERTFVKIVITRLRGRAATAVEDDDINSVTELCNRLKDVFGPRRTVDHYRGEMSNIFMGQHEHMLDFISRVKDLREAIVDCDRGLPNVADIDDLTVNSFINGLIPRLRSDLRDCYDRPLPRVFDEAISLYKQYELDKSRYGSTNEPRRNPYTENRDRNSDRREYRSDHAARYNPPIQRGAWRDEPPKREFVPPKREYNRPAQPNNYSHQNHYSRPNTEQKPRREEQTERNNRVCNYCKTPGHDIHECRKREYNNKQRDSGNGQNLPSPQNQRREANNMVHTVTSPASE